MTRTLALLILVLVQPLDWAAADEQPVDVAACVNRNTPEPDTIRAVRFVYRDRIGSERVTRVRIYGRHNGDGMREMVAQIVAPKEIQGSALLLLERSTGNELYFKPSSLETATRITGASRSLGLFGTDLSFEDFERINGLAGSASWKRLDDDKLGGRAVYVVEISPPAADASAYATILSFVDKKTCITLRMELYEAGRRLRKVFTVNPNYILKKGSVWVPQFSMMQDLRDFTMTQVLVDSSEHDLALSDDLFTVGGLELRTP